MNVEHRALSLVPSAALAWLTMIVLGVAFGTVIELRVGHVEADSLAEYAILFPVVMAVPFAFVIAAVHVPAILLARRLAPNASPMCLSIVGAAAAPAALLLLLAAGSVFWGPPHFVFIRTLLGPGLAIAIGGALFGAVSAYFARLPASRLCTP